MVVLTLAAVLSLLALGDALAFPDATIGQGFVHVPVTRRQGSSSDRLRRRSAGSPVQNVVNAQNAGFLLNISLGTPGQQMAVVLDTGSIELWVNPDCSAVTETLNGTDVNDDTNGVDNPDTDPNFCAKNGRYDPSKSSTSKPAGIPSATFGYGDFTTVVVNYYEDSVSVAGVTIDNQIFGVANASNETATGIMGIGPDQLGFNHTPEYPYTLMLSNLAHQGLIQSRAFSLGLGDFDNTTGSLIFGGVDKGKYMGALQQIPFQTVSEQVEGGTVTDYSYWVQVQSMTYTAPNATKTTSTYSLPGGSFIADLDTGTGALLLPGDLSDQICTSLDGTNANGACVVDCAARQQSGGVSFGFGGSGSPIQVPFENLLEVEIIDGTEYCYLAAGPSGIVSNPPTYILGAPFMRSAYAVFDWDNQNVHLAQAANCGTDIVAIGNGTNSVPTGNGNCGKSSPAPKSTVLDSSLLVIATLLAAVSLL